MRAVFSGESSAVARNTAGWCPATELDDSNASDARQREFGAGVFTHGHVTAHANARDHSPGVAGIKLDTIDRADLDTVVFDATAFAQAGHRLVENDVEFVELTVGAGPCEPHREDESGAHDEHGKKSDEYMVRARFHN